MFGVILVSIGAFFEELSASIGKREIKRREESVYAMGFLNALWGVFFFAIIIVFFRSPDTLTFAAWPTFLLRMPLTLTLAYLTVNAIAKADRSTFSFIRTGTIPLLLMSDVLIGIPLGGYQLLGLLCIVLGLLFLYKNHGLSKKGRALAALSAVNAAVVLGIYKYNITHGNSVELEQFLDLTILLIYFYLMSRYHSHERPFALLKKPILAVQSGSVGLASVFESFAYIFAPASVILAASRSASVLFSVLSGGVYFHEKHISIKILSLAAFIGGIILLAIG